jgi:guanylate kinase
MQRYPAILFSVSATTRPRRKTEVDGKDYFFLSREEFQKRIEAGALVEWEEIYGDLYGTLRSEVERTLREGGIMLFDVDIKGALSIKRHYPEAVLFSFGLPALIRSRNGSRAVRRRMSRPSIEDSNASPWNSTSDVIATMRWLMTTSRRRSVKSNASFCRTQNLNPFNHHRRYAQWV